MPVPLGHVLNVVRPVWTRRRLCCVVCAAWLTHRLQAAAHQVRSALPACPAAWNNLVFSNLLEVPGAQQHLAAQPLVCCLRRLPGGGRTQLTVAGFEGFDGSTLKPVARVSVEKSAGPPWLHKLGGLYGGAVLGRRARATLAALAESLIDEGGVGAAGAASSKPRP
jgi:hypothetical protein